MNDDPLFLDTNILVYAYDRSEPVKQKRARVILGRIEESGSGALSTQVLIEFFSVVTRKLTERMSAQEGYSHLREYVRSWKVLSVTPEIIIESARGVAEYKFPIYDAQIWATAKENGISIVLSEDFSHGSGIEGVKFLNPFIAALPGEE
jgi:predicted nucleic acid-binding protein